MAVVFDPYVEVCYRWECSACDHVNCTLTDDVPAHRQVSCDECGEQARMPDQA